MGTKPIDRRTESGLSVLQEELLIAAWRVNPKILYPLPRVPHGVARSLVMRGFLRPRHGGYLLTEEGDHLIRGVARHGSRS